MNAYSVTNTGKMREINQDSIFTTTEAIGNLPNLFIIADGMGGHRAGEIASSLAISEFKYGIENSESRDTVRAFRNAASYANDTVYDKSNADGKGELMGTTIVVSTIEGNKLTALNIGDSRLYIFDGKLTQITKDHSVVEELIREGVVDRNDPIISQKRNEITRAIGAEKEVSADIFEKTLEEGQSVLMCSDGLYVAVSEEKIAEILTANKDKKKALKKLVDAANDNGGPDNISIIYIEQ